MNKLLSSELIDFNKEQRRIKRMNEIIEIIEPSEKIFDLYEHIKEKIMNVLPKANVRLIGSFAVPMCGKKEIDILVEINNIEDAQKSLKKVGFSVGPIIDGEAYLHLKERDIICELHILEPNDKKIKKVYDKTINTLKENKALKESFEKLKRSLNGKTSEEYKRTKQKFIEEQIFGRKMKERL
jgi:GrpB-like predicted nucleotidyltransferase (UPF0157 family)